VNHPHLIKQRLNTALPSWVGLWGIGLITACGPTDSKRSPGATQNAARQPRPSPPQAQVKKHFSSKGCEGCHPQQYAQWKHSMHAKAHTEPVYDFYFMTASREDKKLETFCGRCHTPIGTTTGQIPFKHALHKRGDTRVSSVASEGLGCDFCHTITGHTKVSNAGFVFAPSLTKRGPLADARPMSHKAKHDPYYRTAEYCGTCHQVIHPTNGIHLETTYAEWKASPYAKAGVVCQDCHMTRGLVTLTTGGAVSPGQPVRHRAKAAIMGKPRKHVSDHYFVGPNLMFIQGSSPDVVAQRKRSEALLRQAAKVEVAGVTRKGGAVKVIVRVTNKGAGHSIPTGVSEIRQVWLEVKVTDAKGRVLLHSGARDKSDHILPGAVVYRTHVYDAKGRDTTLFWRTVKKGRDRRIPPLKTLTETYKIPASAATRNAKKLVVEVALQYRSVPPWGLVEAGVPKGTVKVPIFTMCTARKEMPLRAN
jgi:Cytochrome c554 and c-prime